MVNGKDLVSWIVHFEMIYQNWSFEPFRLNMSWKFPVSQSKIKHSNNKTHLLSPIWKPNQAICNVRKVTRWNFKWIWCTISAFSSSWIIFQHINSVKTRYCIIYLMITTTFIVNKVNIHTDELIWHLQLNFVLTHGSKFWANILTIWYCGSGLLHVIQRIWNQKQRTFSICLF